MRRQIGLFLIAVAAVGCGSAAPTGGGAPPPLPAFSAAPGDTAAQIMLTTGEGFVVCSAGPHGDGRYEVQVCGDAAKATAVLDDRFPGKAIIVPHGVGGEDARSPQNQVLQWWVGNVKDSRFTVVDSRFVDGQRLSVGVSGDPDAARDVFGRAFPGRVAEVRTAVEGVAL
ncbi:hypothetical protein ACGFX4_21960 [Kitasatospora sp. NPDC048365]|uniref:hypothetical protein n=1 Tax=Kitasatospora sp. NPDC048365 TaxID=3364050 RepID=UPI00371C14C2